VRPLRLGGIGCSGLPVKTVQGGRSRPKPKAEASAAAADREARCSVVALGRSDCEDLLCARSCFCFLCGGGGGASRVARREGQGAHRTIPVTGSPRHPLNSIHGRRRSGD